MTPVALLNLLEKVADEVNPDIQLATLRTFLFVASRGKCTQKDVEEYLGGSNAMASRNVSYWTDRKHDRSQGMGFINREEDDYDRRMRNLTLTKKGQAFYNKLKEML